ncbi:MAG: hypothetical protein GX958_05085 [Desulfitobacterium sp.]|nr:hypothetical protein [Desulfitobacterium sp.]
MSFITLVILEWFLLLAATLVFFGGIRGTIGAIFILSCIAFYTRPDSFWVWETSLLIGVGVCLAFLYFFAYKAGQGNIVMGLAGGIAGLVVFGALMTPFIAILIWALVMGVGLIPQTKLKNVLWGFSPVLWRGIMGLLCILVGNLMI